MKPYTFKQRKSKIKDAQQQSLMHLIESKELTIAEKRELVAERNPFIYALGIGRKDANNKTVSQT